MNSKRSLMTALIGVAMLAMPLTAAAKDHGRFHGQAFGNRHEFHNGRNATWMPAPAVVDRHDWDEDRHEWKHGWKGGDGDADDYQNYGRRGYYPAPVYAAPVYAAPVYSGYGRGYGGGQGCANAQRVMRTYARDRATGHPAAAADLLRQNQWAMRSGCASGAPLGGGFLGGLGGFGGQGGYRGVPAYNNYGGYNGGYNGAYNGGYNGGYGQPYGNGSMLAPLLQYIR